MLSSAVLRTAPSGPPLNWGRALGEIGGSVVADIKSRLVGNVAFPAAPDEQLIGQPLEFNIPSEEEAELSTFVLWFDGYYEAYGAEPPILTRIAFMTPTVPDGTVSNPAVFQVPTGEAAVRFFARETVFAVMPGPTGAGISAYPWGAGTNSFSVYVRGSTVAGVVNRTTLVVARLLGAAKSVG
jgi:hypothetical protein